MNGQEIRFIDLFGGVGGFSLGLGRIQQKEMRKERAQHDRMKEDVDTLIHDWYDTSKILGEDGGEKNGSKRHRRPRKGIPSRGQG